VLKIAAQQAIENILIITDSDLDVVGITKIEKLATWIRCDWKGLNSGK